MKVGVREHEGPRQCAYCRAALDHSESEWACAACKATYHYDCARELGRCGGLGCGAELFKGPPPVVAGPASARRSGSPGRVLLVVTLGALLFFGGFGMAADHDLDPPHAGAIAVAILGALIVGIAAIWRSDDWY